MGYRTKLRKKTQANLPQDFGKDLLGIFEFLSKFI